MDTGAPVAHLLAGAIAVFLTVVVVCHKQRRQIFAVLLGVTAVLVNAQVAGVHAFTITAILWFICSASRFGSGGSFPSLTLGAASLLLIASVPFGDLVNSYRLALQLAALTATAILIALRSDKEDRAFIGQGALGAITVGSSLAALQVVGVVPARLVHPDISSIGRPTGIWPEPDWLGLFAAIGLLLAWEIIRSRWLQAALISLHALTLVLSFARAAWIALAVGIAFMAVRGLLARRERPASPDGRGRGHATSLAVLTLTVFAVLTSSPAIRGDLAIRVESLVTNQGQDVSAKARVEQTQGLIDLGDTALPFGHGLSASGRVGISGKLLLTGTVANNVGTNWLLALWVDGGLLSLPLLTILIYALYRGRGTAAGGVLAIVLVNSFWSNALFFPITWLCLGLLLATSIPQPQTEVGKPTRRPVA